jgi:hypothetical protein
MKENRALRRGGKDAQRQNEEVKLLTVWVVTKERHIEKRPMHETIRTQKEWGEPISNACSTARQIQHTGNIFSGRNAGTGDWAVVLRSPNSSPRRRFASRHARHLI